MQHAACCHLDPKPANGKPDVGQDGNARPEEPPGLYPVAVRALPAAPSPCASVTHGRRRGRTDPRSLAAARGHKETHNAGPRRLAESLLAQVRRRSSPGGLFYSCACFA